MRMGGCERAALDDAACSFHFGKTPSIWPSRAGFFAAGLPGLDFSWLKLFIQVITMYLHVIH